MSRRVRRRQRKQPHTLQVFLIIVLVLLTVCVLVKAFFLKAPEQKAAELPASQPAEEENSPSDEEQAAQEALRSHLERKGGFYTILVSGVDDGNGGSDTNILVAVDTVNGYVYGVSIPRDSKAIIDGKAHKINYAYNKGGISLLADTVSEQLGVPVDYTVCVDLKGFTALVDAIGGVEVEVTKAEAKEVTGHPKRYGNVKLKAGKHNLTGKQALAYCRIRKIDTDFVRTKRQRTVMNAIIKKMKSSNPFTLYKMASNAAPYIETDMTKSELCSFVAKAGSCATSTHQARVPFPDTWWYDTINGNSIIAINKEENKKQLIDFIYNKTSEQLDKEEAAAAKD